MVARSPRLGKFWNLERGLMTVKHGEWDKGMIIRMRMFRTREDSGKIGRSRAPGLQEKEKEC